MKLPKNDVFDKLVICLNYESLSKIYYKDSNNYLNIYQARFNAPFTKHFNFDIREFNRKKEYPAFLCYTEELFLLLEKIYRKYERFSHLISSVPPVVIHQFALSCIVSEVKSTNDIEGVYSTRKEIEEIITGVSSPARLEMIVKKYISLTSGEHFNFKTCEDIRNFYDGFAHEEITTEKPQNKLDGKIFRKGSVSITSATNKAVHQGVYPEGKIIAAMNTALEILNNESIPYLVRVAIFHYMFGYIHPFYDGNGRTSRFITSYYLAQHFHYLAALRLSLTIKKKRQKYYDLFKLTNSERNCGDMTPFVLGFISIIDETFAEVENILNKKSEQLKIYSEVLSKKIPQDKILQEIYFLLLQAALFFGQGITVKKLVEITGASENTVRTRLKSIPEEHIIKNTIQRAHYFKLDLKMLRRT